MSIRLATEADVPEIRSCVREAYQVYLERMDRPPAPMQDDPAVRVGAGQVYVECAESVRGVLVLVPFPDHVLVENLAVRPVFQRHGIGSRLLAFAEARATELGRAEVRLYTNDRMTENLRYYSARGYRETGRAVEDGYARVFLSKSAAPLGGAQATRPDGFGLGGGFK
ncbi:MAG: GNAT family N-acetyltransferase [Thermoplasmata archaeon]|nr:GNAT family N-acetyltransferase [Thermoplasmata archaeon]